MAEPVERLFSPVGAPLGATIGATLAAGEGWFAAEALTDDGRPALVVDQGTLADLMPPDERGEYGAHLLVFESLSKRDEYAARQGWTPRSAKVSRQPQTVLGHLAAVRGDVFAPAEVLCTLALEWVLRRSVDARCAFAPLVGSQEELVWIAEDLTAGVEGRPDLVGRTRPGNSPSVIVEAKLSAPLEEAQLRSFHQLSGCRLMVLVPEFRTRRTRLDLERWGLEAGVVSWEAVFSELAAAVAGGDEAAGDLAQLADLYRQVERSWIAPLTPADLGHPVDRFEDLVRLTDRIASALADHYGFGAYPLHRRPNVEPRRYVFIGEGGPLVAVGLFPSLATEIGSPIALMIHRDSPGRDELLRRCDSAGLPLIRVNGNAYLPLQVPTGAAEREMIEACFAQARSLIDKFRPYAEGRPAPD